MSITPTNTDLKGRAGSCNHPGIKDYNESFTENEEALYFHKHGTSFTGSSTTKVVTALVAYPSVSTYEMEKS
jgi:hypothetical protein